MTSLRGRALNGGSVQGNALVLSEPLNLWDGLDADTGRIVAEGHAEKGMSLAGKILVLQTKGATAGGSIAEALRQGVGPAGILLANVDTSVVVAAVLARELYDKHCPVLNVDSACLATIRTGDRLHIKDERVDRVQ